MSILSKLNTIIAVFAIGFCVSLFFIDIELPFNVINTFLTTMLLLFGIEKVKADDNKLGYLYIITGTIIFSVMIFTLF
ncbi:hypothetical protein AOX59_06560 [Lentibacillus amyloliquefaciens]|uniref:DUF3953 domain-containing protein n=1 Tax=Lentibacillus amyloliquefaciens TaxID=1472767 RepID=A0A0U4G6L1_9BACI|nr:hypothetical protein AOX59_06560 [Lentibacillus amyloliquefaciens]